MGANARADLVEKVFLRCLDARRDFSRELERCAIKGWPDRSAAIRNTTRVQELFFSQLSARLTFLVRNNGIDDCLWSDCTSTARVHERVQDQWSTNEEELLSRHDTVYGDFQRKIAALQAIADPQSIEEAFRMAKRDPELIAAAWKLNDIVLALDRELAI